MREQSWRNVRRRAQLVAHGNATADAKWAREVVTCGWPRGSMVKRVVLASGTEPDTQGSRVSTAALWAGKSKAWTAWSHRVALEPLRGAGQNADPTVFDYICRHLKRTDFCLWSAPPAPLAGVVGALLGDDFPRTVYEHDCSGFLQDWSRSVKLIPVAPVVSENILLCGMREVNASLSKECDRNHWVAQQNWWRWR